MKQQIINRLPEDFPWQNKIHWFDSIDSTNTRAKMMALSGAPHGTVLIAGSQTGGRGRMGRFFHSPEGMGVYMSVILRPQCGADRLMHLTCAAAVAMCNAVEQSAGIRPGIKWTNDLVWNGRKLGGILTELVTVADETCVIIGIGINCCQSACDFAPEIQDMACSLAMVLERPVCKASVAAAMIAALQKMDTGLLLQKESMLDTYRQDCVTTGKDICLIRGNQVRYGYAADIDENGALVVSFQDGHTETVSSGEVSVRGMYGYI